MRCCSIKSLLLVVLLHGLLTTSLQAAARHVKDAYGQEHEVPATPQRIIVLSEIDLDSVLALGIHPIGAVNGRGQTTLPRYLPTSMQQGIAIIGDLDNPNLEQLAALTPDLILTGPAKPELLTLLNQIAPTLVTAKWGAPWQESLQRIATIVGRQKEADAVFARYQQRVTEVRAQLQPWQGKSISIVRWNPKGPAYMFKDSFASRVITDLGLRRPAHQQDPGHTHSQALSLESLERLDGDWLLIGTLSATGDAVDALEQARTTPAFRQLGAIRRGHFGAVDGSLWTSTGGPYAALQLIADVQKLLVPAP
ncbi:MAG: iron-siderophore ABC transporter substrate-binding protein [Aeromonadaceae bacterium]